MKLLFTLCMALCLSLPVMAKDFVFTAIPDQDETNLISRFSSLATYLSKELGVTVKFVPVKSYAAAVTAFRNNQVQLAWFGGLSGVRARTLVPDSKAIAQGEEDQAFVTYFIAHASTGLKASTEFPLAMKALNFTFGSKGSTSGRLMPEFYIREYFKAAPDDVFKRVGFSGNHSKTIALVQSGAYQVGAVNFEVWERELKEGKIDTSKVSVIWKTPTYPDYQWTIRGDVDAAYGKGFTDKVTQTLLALKDRSILDQFPRTKFIPAKNSDYEPIFKTGKAIGLLD